MSYTYNCVLDKNIQSVLEDNHIDKTNRIRNNFRFVTEWGHSPRIFIIKPIVIVLCNYWMNDNSYNNKQSYSNINKVSDLGFLKVHRSIVRIVYKHSSACKWFRFTHHLFTSLNIYLMWLLCECDMIWKKSPLKHWVFVNILFE